MRLDTAQPLQYCFCAVDGHYEYTVNEELLLNTTASYPDDAAGCSSCDADLNPTSLFNYTWSGDTLSLYRDTELHHVEIRLAVDCCRVRGDYDHDGALDISDIVGLIDYMFNNVPPPICLDEADINGDGAAVIDISDLWHLANYMFNQGPPPVPCY